MRIIAKETIDERMLAIQRAKTKEIQAFMSQSVLNSRASVKELLSCFGEVTEFNGCYTIKRPSKISEEASKQKLDQPAR